MGMADSVDTAGELRQALDGVEDDLPIVTFAQTLVEGGSLYLAVDRVAYRLLIEVE